MQIFPNEVAIRGGVLRFGNCDLSDSDIESYALVTTNAGPDVAPYHNRQPVILERGDYAGWMNSAVLPDAALKPPQPGLLKLQASK